MKKTFWLVLMIIITGCGSSGFLPADFKVPEGFETEMFRVRPITVADAEKDYEAVMESVDIIHKALLSDSWPDPSFTLEQNRRDLAKKEQMFQRRRSFTYTVVSPDESKVLGCIYINKGIHGPDAAVFMWVRRSALDSGLEPVLREAVAEWISTDWPFKWVVYPGNPPPEAKE